MSGSLSYHAGLSAEASVAEKYRRAGYEIIARRWRSAAGEIDLIARKDGNIVFVEVKKSRSFDRAAQALGPRQISRICTSAAIYLDGEPAGQNSPARIDLAMVNGVGQVKILPNAVAA